MVNKTKGETNMSYEKVKYVSIKNQTITSACNNLRPLYYETFKPFKDKLPKEEFIKFILINFLDGNLQGRSKSLNAFNETIYLYKCICEDKEELYNKRWNNYDYKTKTYRYGENAYEEATKEVKDILYGIYQKVVEGYSWTPWKNIGWYKTS